MGKRRSGKNASVGAAAWKTVPPRTSANCSGKPLLKLSPKAVPKPSAKPTSKALAKPCSKPIPESILKPSSKASSKPTVGLSSKPIIKSFDTSSHQKDNDFCEEVSLQPATVQDPGPDRDQSQDREDKVEGEEFSADLKSIARYRHSGVFLHRNSVDAIQLLTRNTSSSSDDYGEQRIMADFRSKRCEFRSWSPFQSKLAAGIMSGVSDLHLHSGAKVLYLGAGFGRSVSHVSDIVGETGMVYAVEQGIWSGRQLVGLASHRHNIVAVIEDATMPYKYCRQVPAGIDVIFCDLPQPDQVRSLMLNARHFLAPGGHFVAFLHGPSIDSKVSIMEAFAAERERLMLQQLKTLEMVTLNPFKPGYALVVGVSTRQH